jgi:hypothetical protein
MSRFKNDGISIQEYVYDFAVDGGATGAIDLSAKAGYAPLPDNAIVLEVYARVITAISGDSSTLTWGNTTSAAGYSGSAIAEGTLVQDYVTNGQSGDASLLWDGSNDHSIPFLCNSANDRDFSVTIGNNDLTAGKMVFMVKYLYDSLAAE